MQVPRIDFCSLVPTSGVRDALGTPAQASTSWGNGDVAAVTPRSRDVVHELGCQWSNDAGAQARAWVFAQPVLPSFARTVVAAAGRERGCRVVRGPAFGTPSVTQLCRRAGVVARVRHAGLFGQTWLSCEVTREGGVPAPEVRERADEWCVEVADALDAVS
jgi:hypothetical protein